MKQKNKTITPWWMVFFTGLASVIFGIISLAWPQTSLALMVIFLGVWALIKGTLGIVHGVTSIKQAKHWWLFVLEGALSLLVGFFIFFDPKLSLAILYLVIAGWAILMGFLQLITAFVAMKGMPSRWLLAAMGAFSLILGILLVANYKAGLLVFVWSVGIFALFYGVFAMALALGFREVEQKMEIKK